MRADPSLTVASIEVSRPAGRMSPEAKAIHAYWRGMESKARTTKVDAGHKSGDREARKQVAERIASSVITHHENDDREHTGTIDGATYSYRYCTTDQGRADQAIAILEPRILKMWSDVERQMAEESIATIPHVGTLPSERTAYAMAAEMRRLDDARERAASATCEPQSEGGYSVKPSEIRALSDEGRAWFRKANGAGWRKLAREQEAAGWARIAAARGETAPVETPTIAASEPAPVKARKPRKARAPKMATVIVPEAPIAEPAPIASPVAAIAEPPMVPRAPFVLAVISGDYLTPSDDSDARLFAALECDQLVLIDGQNARDWYAVNALRWEAPVVRLESAEYTERKARQARVNTPAPLAVKRGRGRPSFQAIADDTLMVALAILEQAIQAGEDCDAAESMVESAGDGSAVRYREGRRKRRRHVRKVA